MTEAKIAELDADENQFSREEVLALDYAEKLAHSHHSMDDAYFDRLRTVFNDEQIVELGMLIGQFIGFGRLLAARSDALIVLTAGIERLKGRVYIALGSPAKYLCKERVGGFYDAVFQDHQPDGGVGKGQI